MEAIKFKTLSKESEIDMYLSKFEGFVGVRLPYDYSMRSTIVGAFKGEEMIGGYMLVTRPQFRSLMFVPDQVKQDGKFFKNDQFEMMEVNGVWISAAVKSASDQYRFWMKMIVDIFMARKKFILLMADLRNANVRNIHSMTNPELLYEGPPHADGRCAEPLHDMCQLHHALADDHEHAALFHGVQESRATLHQAAQGSRVRTRSASGAILRRSGSEHSAGCLAE